MRNYLSKKLKIIFNNELYENLKLEIKILEEKKKENHLLLKKSVVSC